MCSGSVQWKTSRIIRGFLYRGNPTLRTPGADIKLTITFGLNAEVQAKEGLILEVKAPKGYIFADSCLKVGSPQFSKCAGFRNTASLATMLPRLKGTDISVHLAVTNPGETASVNMWSLALFKDGSTQYVNWSQRQGYEISSMKATFKGLNQLGDSAPGYFTFTPVSYSPSAMIYMEFIPPKDQGYNLNCQDVQPLQFQEVTRCSALGVNEPLELKFDNASLLIGQSYTIGIGVANPGGRPLPSMNIWGLLLKDHLKVVFDGNLRIPGLDLKAVPAECGLLGWTSAAPRLLATVSIQLRIHFTMQPGAVKSMLVQAPSGVMFNEDGNTVMITPISLPLRTAVPTQVMGDILRFNLDTNEPIKRGLYNVRFDVSNPSVYPSDNTWGLMLMKDIEVEFSHVFTGYVQGQESPYNVAIVPTAVGGAERRWGGSPARSSAALVATAAALAAAAAAPHAD
eukprot:TRINITY_DN9265_c1_g7_i1.p1 TRINITY_DN9265_c1_g7~~TRINITY_DN9265_c1_g7_i1.p1  ORF type:complete len:455 (-),score=91.85 TRINITY_DN9265_c1_g7_i1:108-1472(-)